MDRAWKQVYVLRKLDRSRLARLTVKSGEMSLQVEKIVSFTLMTFSNRKEISLIVSLAGWLARS
jgi:hypothetical protein